MRIFYGNVRILQPTCLTPFPMFICLDQSPSRRMKRVWQVIAFLVALCLFIGVALGQNTPVASRYSWLSGTIGTVPITMHLHQYGKNVVGYYYYNKQQQPISCRGTVEKDSLHLSAYLGSSIDETFAGIWKASQVSGKWLNSQTNKSLSFALQVDAAKSAQFTYVFVTGSKIPAKGKADGPQAEYVEGTIWPTDPGNKLTAAIRKQADIAANTSPGAAFLKRKNAFLADYVKETTSVSQKELTESGGMYSRSTDSNLILAYLTDQLAVLASSTYEYTGGAHGNYGTAYSTIDLKTGKVLNLSDILTPAGKQKLPALLAANFRKQYGVKPNESLESAGLFEKQIKPNDNFYLTATNLTFCYNPYEIGPYAMGQVFISIPLSQLDGVLNQ